MVECPTIRQLVAGVKVLSRREQGTFQTAWTDSFTSPAHCCEQGGFIYIDFPVPATVTRAWVTRAPKGATMNQKTAGPNASIDLNSPGIQMSKVILVANFHTHPLSEHVGGGQQPSRSDVDNAFARGLPGIVISRAGIYAYGPEMRESTENPKGYPPRGVPSTGRNPQLVPAPIGGLPWPAPFQWNENLRLRATEEQTPTSRMKTADANDAGNGDDDGTSDLDVILVEWSDEDVVYHGNLVESAN